MLLIQVQKTKVDVDLATAALDKLLKSNELNFAFLGKCDCADAGLNAPYCSGGAFHAL